MERNSRCQYDSDYQQFSNFLRGRRSEGVSCPPTLGNQSNQDKEDACHSNRPIAMVYPVMQEWKNVYDPEIALINGTIFEELDKPFYMSGCSQNGGCRGKGGTQW